jgi:hypothetical protein
MYAEVGLIYWLGEWSHFYPVSVKLKPVGHCKNCEFGYLLSGDKSTERRPQKNFITSGILFGI